MLLKLRERTTKKQFIQIIITIITIIVLILLTFIVGYIILCMGPEKPKLAVPKGAVTSNNPTCTEIGKDIMEKGGNAVDSAIATLLCEGVHSPSTMGLGGGFLMTIYNRTTQQVYTLNAREKLSVKAKNDSLSGVFNPDGAIATPGELLGYWTAYHRFGGGVLWNDLFQPTIDLCKKGIIISNYAAQMMKMYKKYLFEDSILREIFVNPKTNDTYESGKKLTNLRLAKTLEIIAAEGVDAFYKGDLIAGFVRDIQEHGGMITVKDLENYRVEWQIPSQIKLLDKMNFFTASLPSSGIILGSILNVLDGFLDTKNPQSVINIHRLIENFKFAFGRKADLMVDDMSLENVTHFVNKILSKDYAEQIRSLIFDNSTSQNVSYYTDNILSSEEKETDDGTVNVLTPNGDAVSVSSSLGSIFGSKFASKSTGIILNRHNNMITSSARNEIMSEQHPLSSTAPSIILDENKNVALVIGGSGRSKIITSIAQVMVNHLWYKMDIEDSVAAQRFHHQLIPMEVELETQFMDQDKLLVNDLNKIGHKASYSTDDRSSAVMAISRSPTGIVTGVFDRRMSGAVSYVY